MRMKILIAVAMFGLIGCRAPQRMQTMTQFNDPEYIEKKQEEAARDKKVAEILKQGRRGTELHNAVDDNDIEKVKFLISGKVKINKKNKNGVTPIFVASLLGHTEIVSILIQAKANVNIGDDIGVTPLITAAANGHIDIVKLLLDAKADLQPKSKKIPSALAAAGFNYESTPEGEYHRKQLFLDIIELLMDRGAKP